MYCFILIKIIKCINEFLDNKFLNKYIYLFILINILNLKDKFLMF